jgi:xanthine/uracil/vitamin C permease (AzgA family)
MEEWTDGRKEWKEALMAIFACGIWFHIVRRFEGREWTVW